MSAAYEKVVLVTRRTRLQELCARFNTFGQAKFYIEHAGGDFEDYVREDAAYHRSLDALHGALAQGLPVQPVDRGFLPTFVFGPRDVVVTAGQDGLVANTAKYVGELPLVAVNPDPARIDGVLLPFSVAQSAAALRTVLEGRHRARRVTLAEARLGDGQRLLAFNDFYVGAQTHVSSRYKLTAAGATEVQSSSGVIVSTGAGSTGWLSSVMNMAAGVTAFLGGTSRGEPLRLAWEDPRLVYVVREPFASKDSRASLVAGVLGAGEELVLESRMPSGGVLFSDGVEADFLGFNSGAVARLRAAPQRAQLVVP